MLKRKDDKMHLIILGAGGYGRTVADVAGQTEEYSTILFLDDNSVAPDVAGKCAEFARFRGEQTAFYPAFGNNESKEERYKTSVSFVLQCISLLCRPLRQPH